MSSYARKCLAVQGMTVCIVVMVVGVIALAGGLGSALPAGSRIPVIFLFPVILPIYFVMKALIDLYKQEDEDSSASARKGVTGWVAPWTPALLVGGIVAFVAGVPELLLRPKEVFGPMDISWRSATELLKEGDSAGFSSQLKVMKDQAAAQSQKHPKYADRIASDVAKREGQVADLVRRGQIKIVSQSLSDETQSKAAVDLAETHGLAFLKDAIEQERKTKLEEWAKGILVEVIELTPSGPVSGSRADELIVNLKNAFPERTWLARWPSPVIAQPSSLAKIKVTFRCDYVQFSPEKDGRRLAQPTGTVYQVPESIMLSLTWTTEPPQSPFGTQRVSAGPMEVIHPMTRLMSDSNKTTRREYPWKDTDIRQASETNMEMLLKEAFGKIKSKAAPGK